MAKQIKFDYFHGFESEQFAFYRIPKILFTHEYFKKLSSDAKIVYGLMLDRMSLSIKNGWLDNEDKVYIIFTLEHVMEYMNCGKDKGVKILAELDTNKGIGLIERVKQGLGKPSLIYVKSFVIKENMRDKLGSKNPKSGLRNSRSLDYVKPESLTSENPKSGLLEMRNTDFEKSEVWTAEKQEFGLRNNRSLDYDKTDTNYTNNNYNDISDNNHIIINHVDVMDEIKIYTDIVKTNIDYDILIHDCSIGEKMYIDEIVELMVETISIKRKKIFISGAEYPYDLVKGKLLKVDYHHIKYVLDCLDNNTTKVHNIKAYLLTCLFNAPSTINNFYRAEVNMNN